MRWNLALLPRSWRIRSRSATGIARPRECSGEATAGWLQVALGASFVAVLLAPGVALASQTFPNVLVQAWELEGLPKSGGSKGCLLCHATDLGVTVTTPFGKSVDAAGTAKRDNGSFVSALNSLRSKSVDSDDDGISDYRELAVDGTNPNDADDLVEPPPEPPAGGAGGVAGGGAGEANGTSEEGGAGGFEEPDFVLPELPRLPEHGCSLHPGVTRSPHSGLLALIASIAALRRCHRSRFRVRSSKHH